MFFDRKQSAGNAIVAALMVLAMSGVLIYIYSDFFRKTKTANVKTDSLALIELIQGGIVWTIENDEAWKATVAANTSMSCLANQGQTCPLGTYPLAVYFADGTLSYNGADPSAGFDYYGSPCTGFSATAPNDECPFSMTITWTPKCSGSCSPTTVAVASGIAINPAVQINIAMIYSGTRSDIARINLAARFNKDFTRGSMEGSLAASCRSMNGLFDPVTQICQVQKQACPPLQVLTGFDLAGNPICGTNRFLGVGCGPSFAPVGIVEGGGFRCSKF